MQRMMLLLAVSVLFSCTVNSQSKNSEQKTASKDTGFEINRTDEEWKAMLTPEQYYILREKGTDRPFTGKYYLNHEKGIYSCAACGAELFTSDMKFDSECGWPSFDKEIAGGKIKKVVDTSHGMVRTEIVCARCGSHLGHLFDDGPTLTGKRYCVNSTSIDFQKKDLAKKGSD
ncbi:MAG TPA: peptide-methionine (R)-S-oxide reductase MsrB [Cyclobacteriaceae bacterium]|nr:peptide-methionine (R)-S-oxide reductase MsrB [Cyclobacteriaceae bacterium]